MPEAEGTCVRRLVATAAEAKSQEEALGHKVRVCDEIYASIEQRPEALLSEKGDPR